MSFKVRSDLRFPDQSSLFSIRCSIDKHQYSLRMETSMIARVLDYPFSEVLLKEYFHLCIQTMLFNALGLSLAIFSSDYLTFSLQIQRSYFHSETISCAHFTCCVHCTMNYLFCWSNEEILHCLHLKIS